jgi:hypothetical protein
MLTFRSSLAILTNSILTLYRMARTKLTPRKMTRPKGVPRHQLAPRNDGASSSCSNPQAEVEMLNAELARATRDRALDSIRIGKLKGQLRQSEAAHQNCEQMIDNMFQDRNEAWH